MSYILTTTGEQFKPEGIAGELPTNATDEQTKAVLFYRSYTTGPQGAHYELMKEKHHTEEEVSKARNYIRKNFDVVSIHILNEKA